MNTRQIASAFTIFVICVFSLTQTTTVSCNKNKSADAESATSDSMGGADFLEKSDKTVTADGWKPISETVVKQIENNYQSYRIDVASLERNVSRTSGDIRMVLNHRGGMSVQKELLDGLRIMYENYPKQDSYSVQIAADGDPMVESTWPDLVELNNEGYRMDTPSGETAKYWPLFEKAQAEESADDGAVAASVSSE